MSTQPIGQQSAAAAPNQLEVIKTKFSVALTKEKYQEAFQRFSDYAITEDNIEEALEKIKAAAKFLKVFDNIKENLKRPALTECQIIDKVYKDTKQAFDELLKTKKEQALKITQDIETRKRKEAEEKQRKEQLQQSVNTFILEQAQKIAAATTDSELVSIEKLIGSHKGNTSRYQEFLPDLVKRCEELTPLIKAQKESIRKMEELKKQEEEALKSGDDETVIKAREEQELLNHTIEETKVSVQETAINQSTEVSIVDAPTVHPTISYRRKQWKWEVKDINVLHKKLPHLTVITPDEKKIDELLKTKKADGSLTGIEELEYNGIRFYLDKQI